MPTLLLQPHSSIASPVTRIAVEVVRTASDTLHLTYTIAGDWDDIIIPSSRPAERTDGLWRHSCFEIFLAVPRGYYEFNFSPSSQWAAYQFDAYREGMRDLATEAPTIGWQDKGGERKLVVMQHLPRDLSGRIGLSAVIESKDGSRSFWALAHPPGAPDFHHAACFAAELPPAD